MKWLLQDFTHTQGYSLAVLRIRIRWTRIRILIFDELKIQTKLQLKKVLIFFINSCNILIWCLHDGLSRYRRSLQNFKTWNLNFFFWGGAFFCLPGSGSGARHPIESGSNRDPDPKHWRLVSLTLCLVVPHLFIITRIVPVLGTRMIRYRTHGTAPLYLAQAYSSLKFRNLIKIIQYCYGVYRYRYRLPVPLSGKPWEH